MRMYRTAGSVAALLVLATTTLTGQAGVGLAVHAGTLGLGADLATSVTRGVGLRVGGNFMPVDFDVTESDINFTIDLPSPQFTAILDLVTPIGFRVSAGALYTSSNIEVTGNLNAPVDVGGTIYTPTQIGNLRGVFVTNDLSPYVGIGWGNPGRSRVGFFLDLGVAFQGSPEVQLSADGTVSSSPLFQSNLRTEEQNIQNDLDPFQYYPVISIGLSFRLGLL